MYVSVVVAAGEAGPTADDERADGSAPGSHQGSEAAVAEPAAAAVASAGSVTAPQVCTVWAHSMEP